MNNCPNCGLVRGFHNSILQGCTCQWQMASHGKSRTLSEQAEYERGFIDGMQKQMQSSVDKAVNRMATPQQIEKLEAQLGEAVWNYGEAMRELERVQDAVAAEREACAKVCEDTFYSVQAADAIRARGEKK